MGNPEVAHPRPGWIKLLPNDPYNLPFPSIVVEVAVNDESPAMLQAFAQRYFAAITSVRFYIGVKIWLAGKRFWVGWGVRRPNGTGCRLTSNMAWPPIAWSITIPVNLVYQIPDGNCLWTRNSHPSPFTSDLGHKRGGNSTTDH